jgi:predicted MFS family arabinose efflux permease
MPLALYALAAGSFGIGMTVTAASPLISGYAFSVVVGAPLLTGIFTVGTLICVAPRPSHPAIALLVSCP